MCFILISNFCCVFYSNESLCKSLLSDVLLVCTLLLSLSENRKLFKTSDFDRPAGQNLKKELV